MSEKRIFAEKLWLMLVVSIMVFSPALSFAVTRTPKIALTGEVLASTPSRVTVAELEALPLSSYATFNPFEKKKNTYTGVLLRDLVAHYAKPDCNSILITANDGYKVEFVEAEWSRWDLLLATQTNGKYMGVSASGPAKIVMPYDTAPDIDQETYTPKWIWLIKSIDFRKK